MKRHYHYFTEFGFWKSINVVGLGITFNSIICFDDHNIVLEIFLA